MHMQGIHTHTLWCNIVIWLFISIGYIEIYSGLADENGLSRVSLQPLTATQAKSSYRPASAGVPTQPHHQPTSRGQPVKSNSTGGFEVFVDEDLNAVPAGSLLSFYFPHAFIND